MASITLTWSPAHSSSGISYYRIYKDGILNRNHLLIENKAIYENVPIGHEYSFYLVGVTKTGDITPPSNIATIKIFENLNYNLNFNI